MQALGRINEEHQKVVMPEITVLMRINLPEKEMVFVDQEEKRDLTNGSQLLRKSFIDFMGTPRYLKGKLPQDIPVDT